MALPFFSSRMAGSARPICIRSPKPSCVADCPQAARASDLKQLFRRRLAWSDPVIAAQLRLAEMNAAMPRHDHQRAEHRRLRNGKVVRHRRLGWPLALGRIAQC